jgi:hypothetical protein
MLPRQLQEVQGDSVIMTCKMSRHVAIVPCYSVAHIADGTWVRLAEAMNREDGATQQIACCVAGSTRQGALGASRTIIMLHRHLMP